MRGGIGGGVRGGGGVRWTIGECVRCNIWAKVADTNMKTVLESKALVWDSIELV